MNLKSKIAAGSAAALASLPVLAVDLTTVSAELAEGQTNVETAGAAVLVIAVVIAVFKWVRKAF